MKKAETNITLFDTTQNRQKESSMTLFEIMTDDDKNMKDFEFFSKVDQMIQWGKTYKITIEEVE
jgi:uncharacterized protein (DUF1810 family)